MNANSEEKLTDQTPKWLLNVLPFVSAILGSGALWFAWLRYNSIVNRPQFHWYDWIQPAFIALMGILCLWATLLFILGKPSGLSVFTYGLSIVPLILFSNLVILVFRIIQNIIQGNAQPFLDSLFTQPRNLVIPMIVIVLILLGYLEKRVKNKDNESGDS